MESPLVKGETTVPRARLRLSHLAATDFALLATGDVLPCLRMLQACRELNWRVKRFRVFMGLQKLRSSPEPRLQRQAERGIQTDREYQTI